MNNYIALVNQIPVDQKAPANYPIKKFLLEKIRLIFQNKSVIERARVQKQRDEILEAYKKNVGFDKKLKALRTVRSQLEKAEKDLMEMGLDERGGLLTFSEDRSVYGTSKTTVLWGGSWIEVGKETGEKIQKVLELLKAVEGEMIPYTLFDQLETRMMMASTVGECMAIINAIAGEQVFKVKTNLLALEKETTTK
jgi:hypothetical protein